VGARAPRISARLLVSPRSPSQPRSLALSPLFFTSLSLYAAAARRAKMCHGERHGERSGRNCYVRERAGLVKSICTGQTSSALS